MRKTKQDIERFLTKSIIEVRPGERPDGSIGPESDILAELGLDSLEYATVLLSCERWLGIRIVERGVDWSALSTVGRLAEFLEHQQ